MSSISPSNNQIAGKDFYFKPYLSYLIPPFAASIAIIPAYGDLVQKSAIQTGANIPQISLKERIKGGLKLSPTVGIIVGTQMILQNQIEKKLFPEDDKEQIFSVLKSSFLVGLISAPILAIFNGQTMGLNIRESFARFSFKQASAITFQETAFVCGISAADKLSELMKKYFGDSKANDYVAAFLSGTLGSLAGHPANTLLTRQQSNLAIESARQTMWGSLSKAKAIGIFSLGYKICTDVFEKALP